MAKAPRQKFYAVRKGRQGPLVYTSWEEVRENVERYPGAVHKAFENRREAEEWVDIAPNLRHTYLRGPPADWEPPQATPSPTQNRGTLVLPSPAVQLEEQPDVYQQTPKPVSRASHMLSPPNTPPTTLPTTQERDTSMTVDPPAPEMPPALPAPPPIILSPEQRAVLDMVKSGRNVFFTGAAGTGKSVLLREIIKHCGGRFSEKLAITAATGIASVNIGGCTLHSWAGIGLGKDTADMMLAKNRVNRRWRLVDTLIIDEISMVDGLLFDKLEYLARGLRSDSRPFGGIQLVLSGDFSQLPPVPDMGKDGEPVPPTFAFDARCWAKCIGKPVVLYRVFRQKDQRFVDMLNSMRFGSPTVETIRAFKKLSRRITYKDGIDPTELFATRKEVDNANHSRLNRLGDPKHVYKATDRPGLDKDGKPYPQRRVEAGLERLVAQKEVVLRTGAQVMLITNLVQGELVNGSVGCVVAFSTPRDARSCGTDIAQTQMSDGKRAEAPNRLLQLAENYVWPIVQFGAGQSVLCIPTTFEVVNADAQIVARRDQVPLILAWALSIHKSQGQTLQRVKVSLGRVFEKGQAYVALSRATSMDTLEVQSFNPLKIMAHPRVIQWWTKITAVDPRTQEETDDDKEYWDALD